MSIKMKNLALVLLAFSMLPIASAYGALIRLDPANPIMQTSPAVFSAFIVSGEDATDPHIFLVMTDACHSGLTGDVTVSWPGGAAIDLTITTWNQETVNSVKVPPNTEEGTGYTVASLKDHLGTTGSIWWAFQPILSGPITETPVDVTVVLPSTDPAMLVYALGKSGDTELFNNRVPPTIPGFIIPEAAPLILATASFAALGAYAYKRKKQ